MLILLANLFLASCLAHATTPATTSPTIHGSSAPAPTLEKWLNQQMPNLQGTICKDGLPKFLAACTGETLSCEMHYGTLFPICHMQLKPKWPPYVTSQELANSIGDDLTKCIAPKIAAALLDRVRKAKKPLSQETCEKIRVRMAKIPAHEPIPPEEFTWALGQFFPPSSTESWKEGMHPLLVEKTCDSQSTLACASILGRTCATALQPHLDRCVGEILGDKKEVPNDDRSLALAKSLQSCTLSKLRRQVRELKPEPLPGPKADCLKEP